MHTGVYGNTKMFHNGDFSGEIIMHVPESSVEDGLHGQKIVTIDFDDLRALVLEYLRRKSISNLENMTTDNLEEYLVVGYETEDMVSIINPMAREAHTLW
jgi:hypothetical protein